MSKEQTFRNEDMPFGIANGKSQIPDYGICNLRSEIPSARRGLAPPGLPSLTFEVRIRIDARLANERAECKMNPFNYS
jgi:hypothetical protein